MSEIRKTIYRYSDKRKVRYGARIHMPGTSQQSEERIERMDVMRVSLLTENLPLSKFSAHRAHYQERSTDFSKDDDISVECGTNEATKSLNNIPLDEVVYQDLISLDEVKVLIKPDDCSKLVDRPRRNKNLDPEPNLMDFYRPTKQEFLYCDLLGMTVDLDREETKNCQSYYNFMTIECDDRVNNDFVSASDGVNESAKPIACEEMDLESLDVDLCTIEKFRLLHKNYGLHPPQMKSYFVGPSLYKRSRAWKIN